LLILLTAGVMPTSEAR